MITDLDLISGEFFDYDLPKDKRFLLKYFKTDLQVAFVRYYSLYNTFTNFIDHTGFHCDYRELFRYQAKYRYLMNLYQKVKSELTEENMQLLYDLESGKFKLPKKLTLT